MLLLPPKSDPSDPEGLKKEKSEMLSFFLLPPKKRPNGFLGSVPTDAALLLPPLAARDPSSLDDREKTLSRLRREGEIPSELKEGRASVSLRDEGEGSTEGEEALLRL